MPLKSSVVLKNLWPFVDVNNPKNIITPQTKLVKYDSKKIKQINIDGKLGYV